MEDDKDTTEIEGWKKKLLSQPEGVERYIKDIPAEIAEALSNDPDVGHSVSEAIRTHATTNHMHTEDAAAHEHQDSWTSLMEETEAGPADDELEEEGAEAAGGRSAVMARRDKEARDEREEQAKKLSLYALIQRMDVGGKAKLARSGDKDARTILIKDGSKQVSLSVLDNPKITIQEIEMIAASRNVSEDILRTIGTNKDWCKSYTVILALVNNPKTPMGVSLTHLSRILLRDLRFLSKSKGIPEVIKVSAKKMVQKKTI
jgi:hypothetical protein